LEVDRTGAVNGICNHLVSASLSPRDHMAIT
jgi:hypothetical protein